MNKYKLIFVDDEYEIREGIQTFDFASLGIEFIGSYENGLIAYQTILKDPVDIVITDIRIPLLDGLELIELIHKQFSFIKTVVVSGYDDFNYAKKCIQYGAKDYLLKPLDFEELRATLTKIVNQLDFNKQAAAKNEIIERKAKLSTKLLRASFLKELIHYPLSPSEIEEGCSTGELILDSDCFTVCILRLDSMAAKSKMYSDKDWNLIVFALENILIHMWDDKFGYHLVDQESGNCIMIAVNPHIQRTSSQVLIDTLQEFKKALSKFRGLFRTTVSIGVGSTVKETTAIPISYMQAKSTFTENYASDAVVVYQSNLSLQEQEMVYKESTKTQGTLYERNENKESSKQIIMEAKKYISQNYDRSITLRDVAEHVYVNHSYLSFLFKEVTGKNYIHFLTSYRLQKATYMLTDLQYKIYEVGEMVGYENPRYFSEIFKKYIGKTPHEFRNSRTNTLDRENI